MYPTAIKPAVMFYYQKLELFMLQATEQKAWLKYMKHAQQAALFLAAQLK